MNSQTSTAFVAAVISTLAFSPSGFAGQPATLTSLEGVTVAIASVSIETRKILDSEISELSFEAPAEAQQFAQLLEVANDIRNTATTDVDLISRRRELDNQVLPINYSVHLSEDQIPARGDAERFLNLLNLEKLRRTSAYFKFYRRQIAVSADLNERLIVENSQAGTIQKIVLKYRRGMGMNLEVSFDHYFNDGRMHYVKRDGRYIRLDGRITKSVTAKCEEVHAYDHVKGVKIPFRSPEIRIRCLLPDDEGQITFAVVN